jgi:sec-independent protein translocase protein TatA
MFGLGLPELILIFIVALFVFGPGKLPELGAALGRGIRDFQKALSSKDGDDQIEPPQPGETKTDPAPPAKSSDS